MKTNRLLVVGMLGVWAAGCDGGSSSIKLQDIPEEFRAKVCEVSVECGQAPDEATCLATSGSLEIGYLEAAVEAGRITYDGDAAADCLDAIAGLFGCSYSEAVANDNEPEACDRTFTGTIALGGDCYDDEECVDANAECEQTDTACDSSEMCCVGTCVAGDPEPTPVAIGADCSEADCVDGAYCKDNDTGPPTCAAQVGEGATCEEFSACLDGLICDYDFATMSGTCYRPAAQGATCDPDLFYGNCDRFDNWCDPADSKCKAKGTPGQACVQLEIGDNCAEYAYCHTDGTCHLDPNVGESCAQQDCLGDLDCNSTTELCEQPEPDFECVTF